METNGFKRDQNQYIIFKCVKCNQYSYVKSTQKTKKCLRCNRTYQVKKIQYELIVKGLTNAVETVKRKQNEVVVKKFKEFPDLRAKSDYIISSKLPSAPDQMQDNMKNKNDNEDEYYITFLEILKEIKKEYTKIPPYLLSIYIERTKIPKNEFKVLISHAIKDNKLVRVNPNYFIINI